MAMHLLPNWANAPDKATHFFPETAQRYACWAYQHEDGTWRQRRCSWSAIEHQGNWFAMRDNISEAEWQNWRSKAIQRPKPMIAEWVDWSKAPAETTHYGPEGSPRHGGVSSSYQAGWYVVKDGEIIKHQRTDGTSFWYGSSERPIEQLIARPVETGPVPCASPEPNLLDF